MVSTLLPSYQLENKISQFSRAEQGNYITYRVAPSHCPPTWKEKAARMKHNWAQSQHSIRSWLDRDSRPRVPLGSRTWKMLLGLYSASGMFSRNQPAPGPRSEKNEAWDWTRPVFQIHNPNTQHTTNPTLRLTSRVTAGTTHLWFMCVPVWYNSPFDGHLPQIRPTCA